MIREKLLIHSMDGYKTAMRATLRNNDIQMGDFHNMLISGDWAAIHYDIATISRETGAVSPGTVMEFVKFADYGPELGVRVVEGWAGTKGADFQGLSMIQRPAEKEVQDKILDGVLNAVIPDTDDLAAKYPVAYPTPIETPLGRKIRDTIVQDFDQFNQGMVKSRHNSPVLSAAKAVDLVAAMVAILSLTTALLAWFGGNEDPGFRRAMTGFAGAFVCVAVIVIAVTMIVRSGVKLKRGASGDTSSDR